MPTVQVHLHLTEEAARLLNKYATARTRGAFISDLLVNYDRTQKDGDGIIDALRQKAKEAAVEASRAANALRKYEELYGSSNGSVQSQQNGKKHR